MLTIFKTQIVLVLQVIVVILSATVWRKITSNDMQNVAKIFKLTVSHFAWSQQLDGLLVIYRWHRQSLTTDGPCCLIYILISYHYLDKFDWLWNIWYQQLTEVADDIISGRYVGTITGYFVNVFEVAILSFGWIKLFKIRNLCYDGGEDSGGQQRRNNAGRQMDRHNNIIWLLICFAILCCCSIGHRRESNTLYFERVCR